MLCFLLKKLANHIFLLLIIPANQINVFSKKYKIYNMKKILLFMLSVNLFTVTTNAQTRRHEQYASSVIAYSTQYNATTYSANQILGFPNRYPECSGDSVWAASTENGGREFIMVGYSSPQPLNTIRDLPNQRAGRCGYCLC